MKNLIILFVLIIVSCANQQVKFDKLCVEKCKDLKYVNGYWPGKNYLYHTASNWGQQCGIDKPFIACRCFNKKCELETHRFKVRRNNNE